MLGVAAAVIVVAAGSWYYLHTRRPLPSVDLTTAQPPPAAEPAAEPAIQNPLPAGAASQASLGPLPTLADSDTPLGEAIGRLVGASAVKDFLIPDNIVRHLVVTIDNLPRQKVAVDKRPLSPVAGSFDVEGDELHATLTAQNYARYQPLVAAVSKLDVHQLVSVYTHFYPLFQQSYQDLGYPNGYFNDRLVQVIDNLLASPQPTGAVSLVRPNVMYTYADPSLESRSAGQKLLIRMGPENAAAIKAKLTELRAAIASAPLKR